MQNNRYNNCISLLLILMVIAFTGVGCTKEDRSQCGDDSILLTFKAVINVNGEDVVAEKDEIKELTLYVFSANEKFLEAHSIQIDSTISLFYPDHEELHLVCWGNSVNNQQIVPVLSIGDKLDESLITLNTENAGGTQEKVTNHPDDLFHSVKNIIIKDVKSSTVVMILRHKVASVSIIAKGLAGYSRAENENNFNYVLRSGKKHANFNGVTEGNDVHHTQNAEIENGTHKSGIFNILPSANNIEIDIYKGTAFIHTISKDSEGNFIIAKEGELLNIYADFSNGGLGDGSVNVSVKTTSWGEEEIWKDMF